jgi:hypothetical protein
MSVFDLLAPKYFNFATILMVRLGVFILSRDWVWLLMGFGLVTRFIEHFQIVW